MLQFARVVAVIGLVIWAGVLATPEGRTPLALKGLRKLLGQAQGNCGEDVPKVGLKRRLAAFLLVLAAFAIAIL